jgi:CubicO group peptidase (beta-lactamase class C family)
MKVHAALCAMLVGACGGRAAPVAPARDVDEIDAVITQVRERAHVPGMAVAIVRDGKADVRVVGTASLEWETPVTGTTAFQLASTTKIFTGTLVMLLVQDGRLELGKEVSAYLPDAPEAWRGVTVGHLAAHTSGIADLEDLREPGDAEAAYRRAREQPLRSAPGTEAVYGRTDLAVLQVIVERVGGAPFEAQLRQRIMEPLGFRCTSFEHVVDDDGTRRGDVVAAKAGVYRWDGARQATATFMYPQHSYAAGGMWSCLDDLVKWAQAMDAGRLLSAESERRVATPARLNGGGEGGFSVAFTTRTLHGAPSYGHSGGPGLGDVLRVPGEKLTVVVLLNQQKLPPVVAPVIASLALGPPAGHAGAPAGEGDRALVERLARGEVDEGRVAAETVPILREWMPLHAAAWPALTALALVKHDGAAWVYEASYGPAIRVRWILERDPDGTLRNVDLEIQ